MRCQRPSQRGGAAIEVVAAAQPRAVFVQRAESGGRRLVARASARAVALEDALGDEPAQAGAKLLRARARRRSRSAPARPAAATRPRRACRARADSGRDSDGRIHCDRWYHGPERQRKRLVSCAASGKSVFHRRDDPTRCADRRSRRVARGGDIRCRPSGRQRSRAAAIVARNVDDCRSPARRGRPRGSRQRIDRRRAREEFLIDELEPIGPGLDAARAGRNAYRQDFDRRSHQPGGRRTRRRTRRRVRDRRRALRPLRARSGARRSAIRSATARPTTQPVSRSCSRSVARCARSRRRPRDPSFSRSGTAKNSGCSDRSTSSRIRSFRSRTWWRTSTSTSRAPISRRARATLSFAVGAESGGEMLTALTQQAIDAVGLGDQAALGDLRPGAQRLPVVLGQAGADRVLHRRDERLLSHERGRDRRSSTSRSCLARRRSASDSCSRSPKSAARPRYEPLASLDTYEDLVVLSEFLTRMLADLDVVDPAYQGQLQALEQEARARVAAGPDDFGPTNALTIAQGALTIATRGIPCDSMLLPEPDASPVASIGALALGAAIARRRRPCLR